MIGLGRFGVWGLPAVLALASGCAEELGPERWETARVSGVVTLGKVPVGQSWIEFLPAEGTVGTMRSAPLGADGRFVAEGVAVGVNRVGIDGAMVGVPGDLRRYFDPLGSPIRRTITRSASGPLKIDLIEEYALARAARPAAVGH